MTYQTGQLRSTVTRDLNSGLVVFFVALPLCLGVALASDAPLFSGLLAGIVGGILVGLLSGSQTSISGPAAGLTTIVAAQIALLGSFQAFQVAVVVAGLIQIVLGSIRAGFIAAFFPSSVVKGLLAAIGVILILKQIPHVLGHDPDPEGDMSFQQPDHENTLSEIGRLLGDVHPGAASIGLVSIALLVLFSKWKPGKKSLVPAPLLVVILGVGMSLLFRRVGGQWVIEASHLVQVPVADGLAASLGYLQFPDFSILSNPAVYTSAVTIAAVASLETLLNLEAVDKIDPQQRNSPPSRELLAQGVGNVALGMIGGLPVTSVIARSSVNINAGGQTKLSTIFHGVLLLVSILLFPTWLNQIPLSCLAAILLITGVKLASPVLVKQMWSQGRSQFIPFAVTVASIVLTDLLTGVLIGLATSIGFILSNNVRRPIRRIVEKHLGGEVVHIKLADQVSFLNRASLTRALDELPRGSHVLLDARRTDYIDSDLLDLIRDFENKTGPARGVEVSLRGFKSQYQMQDRTQYVDYSTREIQSALTPQQVLQILKDGHERFQNGQHLTRDFGRQVQNTAKGQHPLAAVLSCIDSRAPAELIFDTGVGDIFSVRVAGNITSRKVLGSLEYACAAAGVKLILVMGHTRCGAVTAAVNLACSGESAATATGCQHLEPIISEIQQSVEPLDRLSLEQLPASERESFVDSVARRNVVRVVEAIRQQSETLDGLVREERIAIVGAVYDVVSGDIDFLPAATCEPVRVAEPA
ncbi:MAG: bifunctional SulP family inorganic anion transporter/carbonic anhydrase [Paludisphaera borealis]|uniref:bifunctional SulP family inorganic anion transporter/carbonic anhydrase n=1 Tax=Paludisphaera borealis TaxID=1387353 RepID=UPI00283E96A8|nr:bifunctional SulP family inorganic anion transporter/carbonic anhydrase [Paludisphaera borealis]MDR3623047.1 bifunctional SulP family inorganic anion transporter/carbonic anhydrase [Paludisphaera borealis]